MSDALCKHAMSDVALPIFTIIAVLLTILPAPSHWRAKNFVVLVLILWLAIGNLNTFINRTVWMKRSANVAPVWCDVCKYTLESEIKRGL